MAREIKTFSWNHFLKACVQHPLSFRGERPSSLLSFLSSKFCDSAYITGRLYVLKVLDQNMLPSMQCLFCRCLSISTYWKDAADARSDLVCSLNSNSNFKIIFKPCWIFRIQLLFVFWSFCLYFCFCNWKECSVVIEWLAGSQKYNFLSETLWLRLQYALGHYPLVF